MADKDITIEATLQPPTKRKNKWSAEALGISIAVYIDKMYDPIPETITLKLGR